MIWTILTSVLAQAPAVSTLGSAATSAVLAGSLTFLFALLSSTRSSREENSSHRSTDGSPKGKC